MAHVVADKDTPVTPREVIGALTDFSDRRLELWPNIDRKYYKVHQVSKTSADVTEGSRGVWERTHYDSRPADASSLPNPRQPPARRHPGTAPIGAERPRPS